MQAKQRIKKIASSFNLYKLNNLQEKFHIIPYHMVTSSPNCFFPAISTQLFERQLRHFAKYYHLVSLEEIVTRVRTGKSIRKCVAITFDDGFLDNYTEAYPLLKKYNSPATIFLTTGSIETGEVPWFIKFRYMFMKTKKTFFQIILTEPKSFIIRTPQQKFRASQEIMNHLRGVSDHKRVFWFNWLKSALEVNDFSELSGTMLNWKQIKEMSQNGLSFGAHTVSHPILTQVSLEQARKEILKSQKAIETALDKEVTTFAYPFGKRKQYSEEIKSILKKAVFQCAVTTEPGVNDKSADFFELKRDIPWELRCSVN